MCRRENVRRIVVLLWRKIADIFLTIISANGEARASAAGSLCEI